MLKICIRLNNPQIHIYPDMHNMYAGVCLHVFTYPMVTINLSDRMSKPGLKTSGFQWGGEEPGFESSVSLYETWYFLFVNQ